MKNPDINQIKTNLETQGVRPSYQRLKVMEYLNQHKNSHPTAEEIYAALAPVIPTLSRATIYNTLHSFSEHGLVNCMSINGTEIHYDVRIEPHGHFKCEKCGKILNFSVNLEDLRFDALENYEIKHRNLIFTGICSDCTNQIKSEKGDES